MADPVQRRYAKISAKLPLHKIDACPDDLLNRILWTNRKGSKAPYPQHYVTLVQDDDEEEEVEEHEDKE